jgi:hypothetical protein
MLVFTEQHPNDLRRGFAIEAERSLLGIGLALTAVVGMPILARIKRKVVTAIGSVALRGDAACSMV